MDRQGSRDEKPYKRNMGKDEYQHVQNLSKHDNSKPKRMIREIIYSDITGLIKSR